MSVKEILEKKLIQMGKNNSPIIAVIGIAVAKGIFRPLITMMDKKENLETKKYTAMREGLTELIAIPVYWISGKSAQKMASLLAKPQFFMNKSIYKQYKNGIKNDTVQQAYDNAQKLVQENLPKLKTNLTFIGVCAAALFFIPSICSMTINPVMKSLNNKKEQRTQSTNIQQTFNNRFIQHQTEVFSKFERMLNANKGAGRI